MRADGGKTVRKRAIIGAVLAGLVGFPSATFSGELVFEPYRCRTAPEGVAFEAPPPKLRVSQPGVRYRLSRGPGSLQIDSESGAVHWSSPTEGRHVIRIEATAGDDSDQVEWILRVVPKVADDLVIHSTKYLDFVVTKRQLDGNVYLHRKDYFDGIWECYSRLIGQEPIADLQVLRWDPLLNGGGFAGNPIKLSLGGSPVREELKWSESDWQRYGVDHELAHNFNFLIRTPGTWSSEKFAEGFGKPWLDQYLHHLCDVDIFILQQTALREPELFGLNSAELKSYRDFVRNNFYYRSAAKTAAKHQELIQSGQTMQEVAKTSASTWGHLINTIVKRDGPEVLEGAIRAMRHDGLPDEIFEDATTPERKLSLYISLLSASAGRDLRPFFAEWGFEIEKDYYNEIHPQVQAEMKKLLPKDVWVDGWIKSPVNGHFYRVLTWKTDREQAGLTARQWGGRLLEIHSAAEQEWVARRFSHLGPVWLGLHDETRSGEWTWASGGRETAPHWNPNDPKDSQNRYAVLAKAEPRGTWRQRRPSLECVVIVERIDVASLARAWRPAAAPPSGVLSVNEARGKIGESVTVQLRVQGTGEIGKLIFLNSHAEARDEGNFPVVLKMGEYQQAAGAVPNPREFYEGKTVRATGEVNLYRGRPQMRITRPDQIEVVKEK